VVASYNAVNGDSLIGNVDWVPSLHGPITPASKVPTTVIRGAGPFK
jgi:hypothetical protein